MKGTQILKYNADFILRVKKKYKKLLGIFDRQYTFMNSNKVLFSPSRNLKKKEEKNNKILFLIVT